MIIRGTLGKDGRPITAKERDAMDREVREYNQKVRDAIAKGEQLKKKPKRGTMHGKYLRTLYGK